MEIVLRVFIEVGWGVSSFSLTLPKHLAKPFCIGEDVSLQKDGRLISLGNVTNVYRTIDFDDVDGVYSTLIEFDHSDMTVEDAEFFGFTKC